MIELRHMTRLGERTYRYKTTAGARRRAIAIVGPQPRIDPDGYAVARNGDTLFVLNAEWGDLGLPTDDVETHETAAKSALELLKSHPRHTGR